MLDSTHAFLTTPKILKLILNKPCVRATSTLYPMHLEKSIVIYDSVTTIRILKESSAGGQGLLQLKKSIFEQFQNGQLS
jgi:hypothetical protein